MDMHDVIYIVFFVSAAAWIGCIFLVGWVADQRGQSGLGWFLLALLTSPIVAGLLLVLLTPRGPGRRRPS